MKLEFDETENDEAEEVGFVEFLKSLLLDPFKKKSADEKEEEAKSWDNF